jgi:hypothetical protein
MKLVIEDISTRILGERKGTATIGENKFDIPTPALTNTDVNIANSIMDSTLSKIAFRNKVLEIRSNIFPKDLENKIYKKNGRNKVTEWVNQQITNANSLMDEPVALFTPGLQFIEVTEEAIIEIVNLQIDSNLDIVNIPDSNKIGPDDMAKIVNRESKKIMDCGKEPFYLISMGQDYEVFSQKITKNKSFVSGVTIVYADLYTYLPNLLQLKKLSNDNKILRILSNVERITKSKKSRTLYPLSFLAADIFSVQYIGFGKNLDPKKELHSAKRFDIDSFEYYTLPKYKEKFGGSTNCDCPVCDGRTVDDIIIDFEGSLYEGLRIHEAVSIQNFISSCLDSYEIGKTFEFLKDSKSIMKAMDDTFLSLNRYRTL